MSTALKITGNIKTLPKAPEVRNKRFNEDFSSSRPLENFGVGKNAEENMTSFAFIQIET